MLKQKLSKTERGVSRRRGGRRRRFDDYEGLVSAQPRFSVVAQEKRHRRRFSDYGTVRPATLLRHLSGGACLRHVTNGLPFLDEEMSDNASVYASVPVTSDNLSQKRELCLRKGLEAVAC